MAQEKKEYFCIMYVRKKKNRSGTISVVVVSKSSGKYREIKCFGTVASKEEAEVLYADAHKWINTYCGQQELDFDDSKGGNLKKLSASSTTWMRCSLTALNCCSIAFMMK